MEQLIDIRTLPLHTRKELVFGKVKDCVLGRSDGFTCKTNLDYPKKGYLVGTGWSEKHFSESNLSTARNHINQIFNSIDGKQGLYIGGWNNDGVCVVEISEGFDDLDNALHIGRMRDQISIWDVEKGEEIVL